MTPTEARIHSLLLQAEAIKAEVAGMQAHDAAAHARGTGDLYFEDAYLAKAAALRALAMKVEQAGKR